MTVHKKWFELPKIDGEPDQKDIAQASPGELQRRVEALERAMCALDPKAFYSFDPNGRRSFARNLNQPKGGGRRQKVRGKKVQ